MPFKPSPETQRRRQAVLQLHLAGLTQAELAEAFGLSQQMISKYLSSARSNRAYNSCDQDLSVPPKSGASIPWLETITPGGMGCNGSEHPFPTGFLDAPAAPDDNDLYAWSFPRVSPGPCNCIRYLPLVRLADNTWNPHGIVPNYSMGERWCRKHGYEIQEKQRKLIASSSSSTLWWSLLLDEVLGFKSVQRARSSMRDYALAKGYPYLGTVRTDAALLVVAPANLATNRRTLSDGSRVHLMCPGDTAPILDGLDYRLLEIDVFDKPLSKQTVAKREWHLEIKKRKPQHRLPGGVGFKDAAMQEETIEYLRTKHGFSPGDEMTPTVEADMVTYIQNAHMRRRKHHNHA